MNRRLRKRVATLESLLGVHSFQLMRLYRRVAALEERACSGSCMDRDQKKVDVASWCTAIQADE